MAIVNTITCPSCGYTVFSRTRHDCRKCFCGKVAIDGGFAYTRILCDPEINPPEIKRKEIPQDPMELYDDWNQNKGIFGWIPPVFEMEEEGK